MVYKIQTYRTMKLEEAIEDIKEHLIDLCQYPNYEEDDYNAGYIAAINENTSEIFKAGVEFAQRWIPIEKELPQLTIENSKPIPTNLEECFDRINEWFDKGVFNKGGLFNNLSEDDFVITNHHILGLKIRNEWGLCGTTSKLVTFFNDMKIFHPDDMSGIILTSYFRKMNNQDIKLDEQIKHYLTYWNNN